MSETLVLTRDFQYCARISWQRAITLLFQNKIEILESYEDRELRSVTFSIKMPSVVRFLQAIRGRRHVVRFSRESVYARDRAECQYQAAPDCPRKLSRPQATYDHVIPKSQGGKTTWTNIVIACVACNQLKGGRTCEQAKMFPKTPPVRPKKLPDMRITFMWDRGMPLSWKNWLKCVDSYTYWNSELENDNE